MTRRQTVFGWVMAAALGSAWCWLVPTVAQAHCDTMDGPVVVEAKAALTKGDPTPVLKWVQPAAEEEIKAAFSKTVAARAKGTEAQEVADRWFLETLVRLHRAGEGAPYTGLAPAGTDPGPAVKGADKALETGSVDDLTKEVAAVVETGIRSRFTKAMELKKHAAESVEAGRQYVAAYVDYVHYVERLHEVAAGQGGHHGEAHASPADPHAAPPPAKESIPETKSVPLPGHRH